MLLKKLELERKFVDGKRRYLTPIGALPSVTTILGNTKISETAKALAAWRKRVGDDEADQISKRAAERGTAMHNAIEATLTGISVEVDNIARPYFASIQSVLPRVTDLHLIEGMVWHPNGFAGSVDCVARYNGELSIIDWKTADKPKRINWIDDYFLQCSAYCAAVNRLYDLRIGRIVVAIAVPDRQAQVFTVNGQQLLEYWEMFNERLTTYKLYFGECPDADTSRTSGAAPVCRLEA